MSKSRTYENVVEFDVAMNKSERVEVSDTFGDIDRHLQPARNNDVNTVIATKY